MYYTIYKEQSCLEHRKSSNIVATDDSVLCTIRILQIYDFLQKPVFFGTICIHLESQVTLQVEKIAKLIQNVIHMFIRTSHHLL